MDCNIYTFVVVVMWGIVGYATCDVVSLPVFRRSDLSCVDATANMREPTVDSTRPSRSLGHCAMLCETDSRCTSFNFNQATNGCELISLADTCPTLVQAPGHYHFAKANDGLHTTTQEAELSTATENTQSLTTIAASSPAYYVVTSGLMKTFFEAIIICNEFGMSLAFGGTPETRQALADVLINVVTWEQPAVWIGALTSPIGIHRWWRDGSPVDTDPALWSGRINTGQGWCVAMDNEGLFKSMKCNDNYLGYVCK